MPLELKRWHGIYKVMKIDYDVLLFATRLVEEMGETAIRAARARLVELTAANNVRAAAFWRDVMRTCERLVSERRAATVVAGKTASLAKSAAP